MQDENTLVPSFVRNWLVKAIDPSGYDISVNIATWIAQMFSAYVVQATVQPSQACLIWVYADKSCRIPPIG